MPALYEKKAIFDPSSPMAKVTVVITVFQYTGLLRFLLSPKNQTSELNQPMLHIENTRLQSESAIFALWMYAFLVVGGFQGGHKKANLLLGAVQKRPHSPCTGPWTPIGGPNWCNMAPRGF